MDNLIDSVVIISYQNLKGNYNIKQSQEFVTFIISYQNLKGNYNSSILTVQLSTIISYQNKLNISIDKKLKSGYYNNTIF